MTMFLEGFKANKTPNTVNQKDTTKLGTLEIPSIGIGTISWSSSSRKWYIISTILRLFPNCELIISFSTHQLPPLKT